MKALRAFAILFGIAIIVSEMARSWGERPVIWWIDDFLVGGALIASAMLLKTETAARRALFTGAWGFSVGVIYISFFDKIIAAQFAGPGAQINPLNVYVTLCLVAAITGFAGSLALPYKS